MKPGIAALLLLTTAVYVAVPVAATHETGTCTITSSSPLPAVVFFSGPSSWAYVESNGILGIQRDDDYEQDQTCGHSGDTAVQIPVCFNLPLFGYVCIL